jgi:transcriptional regulator with XRE-family HTH domain
MTAEPFPGGIGATLRAARERQGIDLRHISNRTRISMRALEALERNDISKLPGGIFSRSFVRAYAVEVGLDPESVVRDFISQFPDEAVTAGHPSAAPEDLLLTDSDRRITSTVWQIALLSAPVAILMLYFSGAGWRMPGSNTAAPTAPSPEIVEPAQPPPPAAAPLVVEPAAAAVASTLRIDLMATAVCWVSATVDGRRAFASEMQPGERRMLTVARDLVLTTGNAGALAMSLNGEEARAIGASGQVVTIRITPDTYRGFLANP